MRYFFCLARDGERCRTVWGWTLARDSDCKGSASARLHRCAAPLAGKQRTRSRSDRLQTRHRCRTSAAPLPVVQVPPDSPFKLRFKSFRRCFSSENRKKPHVKKRQKVSKNVVSISSKWDYLLDFCTGIFLGNLTCLYQFRSIRHVDVVL